MPQLEVEIKFYLQQTAQSIIEVGNRLIQAKELVPHGDWLNWLKDNFALSQQMANNFMRCAERFGNYNLNCNLNQTQMIALLSVPAEDTEKFIAEKIAEGKAVADMTIKQLREEIKRWKAKDEFSAEEMGQHQPKDSGRLATILNFKIPFVAKPKSISV